MLKLLDRGLFSSIEQRLVLLAPSGLAVPNQFKNQSTDALRARRFMNELQRLRGSVYLADGAVQPDQLTPDGRHESEDDRRSWHLVVLTPSGAISGCSWYLPHPMPRSIDDLRAGRSPVAQLDSVRRTVASEIDRANAEGVQFAEVGGWAIAPQQRGSCEGLMMMAVTFGLSRLMGGALGLATATVRHASSTILNRFGFSQLAPYHDEEYGCDMELMRFDTRKSNPKYAALIEEIKERLCRVSVIATGEQRPTRAHGGLRGRRARGSFLPANQVAEPAGLDRDSRLWYAELA